MPDLPANAAPLFEVCVEGVDGVLAAARAGARRVELCASLTEGGISPNPGTVQRARDLTDTEIMVMVRPRGGDFLYTPREVESMLADIDFYRSVGVDGVVFGTLQPDGHIDRSLTQQLAKAAASLKVTFHRAFDMTVDPLQALDVLIELGIDRVLTSGQAATAPEGAALITQLHTRAAGRIGILPGGGLRPENVRAFLDQTGVSEFHATAFAPLESAMTYRNERVYMGVPGLPEYARQITSEAEVRRFLRAARGEEV